ncbi:hypothetical protein BGW80DRAFT_1314003 [Lactifluus volemus]|nr:hypothetical protein BGW80DRAFT_1314003 [Lactifluus volemus]
MGSGCDEYSGACKKGLKSCVAQRIRRSFVTGARGAGRHNWNWTIGDTVPVTRRSTLQGWLTGSHIYYYNSE